MPDRSLSILKGDLIQLTFKPQALEREGVDVLFAYPGGASMEIHQALTRSTTIRNILCRHEQVRPSFCADLFLSMAGQSGITQSTRLMDKQQQLP